MLILPKNLTPVFYFVYDQLGKSLIGFSTSRQAFQAEAVSKIQFIRSKRAFPPAADKRPVVIC
jgi:hypothetical protein